MLKMSYVCNVMFCCITLHTYFIVLNNITVNSVLLLLVAGEMVDFKGPCGGFEYSPNSVSSLTLVASGVGVTPCLQLVRYISANPRDTTNISMLYYAETAPELLYKNELDNHAAASKGMRLFYSVGQADDTWDGAEGYVSKYEDTFYHFKINQRILKF